MLRYSSLEGRLFRLNEKHPVYNKWTGEVVGETDPGDVAVAIYDDIARNDYVEFTVASGKFAGYDGLALNKTSICKATYIGIEKDEEIYASGIKLR